MILIRVSGCDGHYTCEHISFLSMIVQSAVKFSNAEENTIFQSLCPSDYEEGSGFHFVVLMSYSQPWEYDLQIIGVFSADG